VKDPHAGTFERRSVLERHEALDDEDRRWGPCHRNGSYRVLADHDGA
tara:strand:- start:419 stop:559 length:141 start_codon:yes stop_codon:yes gene_type:complete